MLQNCTVTLSPLPPHHPHTPTPTPPSGRRSQAQPPSKPHLAPPAPPHRAPLPPPPKMLPPSPPPPRQLYTPCPVLNLTLPPQSATGIGPIMNLQSNDAAKLWSLPSYIHMIWNGPFQVCFRVSEGVCARGAGACCWRKGGGGSRDGARTEWGCLCFPRTHARTHTQHACMCPITPSVYTHAHTDCSGSF
jgi:hypothetical protein